MGKLLIPKATSTQRLGYIPAVSELVHDTTNNNIYSGDGITIGGNLLRSTNVGAGSVIFLGTQAEYDDQIWSEGDIFIPTASGIVDNSTSAMALPAHIDITWTNAPRFSSEAEAVIIEPAAILGNNRFFTITGSPPVVPTGGIPHIGFSSAPVTPFKLNLINPYGSLNGAYQQQADSYAIYLQTTIELNPIVENGVRRAELLEDVINSIPLVGATGLDLPVYNGLIEQTNVTSPAVLHRTCTVSRAGAQIVLTSNFAGFNSDLTSANATIFARSPIDNGEPILTLFAGQGSSASLNFVENTIYVRRDGNNGWLVFNTATQDFIDS